ncbi:hypothetical protein AB0E04_41900 [Streptomyces sp. NPDC048251]|uniref:hypothetical protein n=1 Tax=Streptomyces sp. NPDC048251 TaxID=3154501 RepID=UPI0034328993
MNEYFVRLAIDGVEVPISATQRLLQRSPYPGGHRYELVLHDRKLIERWFRDIEPQEPPGPDVQWIVFYGLDRVAGEFREQSAGRTDYLLNSVDSIQVGQEEVIFTGVCSKIVESVPSDQ